MLVELIQQNKYDRLAWEGMLHGTTAVTPNGETYVVSDVYLDVNGCTRTGGIGSYNGSSVQDTIYIMAHLNGLEPMTKRLTAACSAN